MPRPGPEGSVIRQRTELNSTAKENRLTGRADGSELGHLPETKALGVMAKRGIGRN